MQAPGRRDPAYYGLPDRLRQARRRQGLSMPAASSPIGGNSLLAALDARSKVEHACGIQRHRRLQCCGLSHRSPPKPPHINTVERFAAELGVSSSWRAYGEEPQIAVQMESTVHAVGQPLKKARRSRGLSRHALGNAAGLPGQTVANIEVHGMIPD